MNRVGHSYSPPSPWDWRPTYSVGDYLAVAIAMASLVSFIRACGTDGWQIKGAHYLGSSRYKSTKRQDEIVLSCSRGWRAAASVASLSTLLIEILQWVKYPNGDHLHISRYLANRMVMITVCTLSAQMSWEWVNRYLSKRSPFPRRQLQLTSDSSQTTFHPYHTGYVEWCPDTTTMRVYDNLREAPDQPPITLNLKNFKCQIKQVIPLNTQRLLLHLSNERLMMLDPVNSNEMIELKYTKLIDHVIPSSHFDVKSQKIHTFPFSEHPIQSMIPTDQGFALIRKDGSCGMWTTTYPDSRICFEQPLSSDKTWTKRMYRPGPGYIQYVGHTESGEVWHYICRPLYTWLDSQPLPSSIAQDSNFTISICPNKRSPVLYWDQEHKHYAVWYLPSSPYKPESIHTTIELPELSKRQQIIIPLVGGKGFVLLDDTNCIQVCQPTTNNSFELRTLGHTGKTEQVKAITALEDGGFMVLYQDLTISIWDPQSTHLSPPISLKTCDHTPIDSSTQLTLCPNRMVIGQWQETSSTNLTYAFWRL